MSSCFKYSKFTWRNRPVCFVIRKGQISFCSKPKTLIEMVGLKFILYGLLQRLGWVGFRAICFILFIAVWCHMTIRILWLFFEVPWVGMEYVSVVFPGHTHILFTLINLEEPWGKSCFLCHFKRKSNASQRDTCNMRNTTSLIINSNTIYSYEFLFKLAETVV